MRLFFAIALSPAIRERVAALVADLEAKAPGAPVGWVAAGNVHLTLRFLGDRDPLLLPRLLEVGRQAAAGASPFVLALEGVGSFGGRGAPRVIWLGVRDDPGRAALDALAASLGEGLRREGLPPDERPFAAHATLGRVRDPRARWARGRKGGRRDRDALAPLVTLLEGSRDAKVGELPVERLVLYESRLQGGRAPEYVPAGDWPLGAR